MDDKILIFEKSKKDVSGCRLPETSVPESELLAKIPARFRRAEAASLPEVTEGEAMRHFIGLSVKNHHIDRGFYPLGSCTMKYNPKRNDRAASMNRFVSCHPLAPCKSVQGTLQIMYELSEYLKEISGFDEISLQPVAGAQGEFAGLLIIRAYHLSKGKLRKKILIPDSAHGTNPASVTMAGFETVQVPSNDKGIISAGTLEGYIDDNTAGLMLTNPNTVGLFESEIEKIADLIHKAGGLIYMDGANLNAQMGIVKPGKIGFDILHFNLHKTFSTPHGGGGPGGGAVGVVKKLGKFLPSPMLRRDSENKNLLYLDYDCPDSIGSIHTFYGNMANNIRAYAYIRTLGPDGIRSVSENAVLNANYLKALLKDDFDFPYDGICQHEFVLSCKIQKQKGARALDIAKRLLDFGYHAPTVYFPLIVPEAFMIEPTETESKETLERFAETLRAIAAEAETNPVMLTGAPYMTPIKRLDEIKAAREHDVCYKG